MSVILARDALACGKFEDARERITCELTVDCHELRRSLQSAITANERLTVDLASAHVVNFRLFLVVIALFLLLVCEHCRSRGVAVW